MMKKIRSIMTLLLALLLMANPAFAQVSQIKPISNVNSVIINEQACIVKVLEAADSVIGVLSHANSAEEYYDEIISRCKKTGVRYC